MIDTETRSPVLTVVCAAFGIGALTMAQFLNVGQQALLGYASDAQTYSPLATLVFALLCWHLWPRRSWVALVVLGALCVVPTQVYLLAPDQFASWRDTPYVVVSFAAQPLLSVGLLGAATAVWRAGGRRGGAVLIGATLATAPLAALVVTLVVLDVGAVLAVVGLVLVAGTVGLAIAAAVVGTDGVEPEGRPRVRVTLAGAVAGVLPVGYHLWRGPSPQQANGGPEVYFEQAGRHALVVGLVVLAAGLLLGLLGGARVLVAGAGGGLLLGAVSALVSPALVAMDDPPVGVLVVLIVGALAAGVGLALPHARVWTGVAVLGLVAVGLAVLSLVFRTGDANLDGEVLRVAAPILLAAGIAAAVPIVAAFGSVLARDGAAPAVLAGVVAGVAAGVGGVMSYFRFTSFAEPSPTTGAFPPVIVALVCAAGLAILAHRRWPRGPAAESQAPARAM